MKNALYGSDHHELCPCAEYEAVLDDQLSDCECPDGWFNEGNTDEQK